MNIEEVNKQYSNTWTRINDDSRREHFRREFLEKFGGEFIPQKHGFVEWRKVEEKKSQPVRLISVINPEGNEVQIENFTKYCRENDLSRSAMYEVLKGKRKQHKGFTAKGD